MRLCHETAVHSFNVSKMLLKLMFLQKLDLPHQPASDITQNYICCNWSGNKNVIVKWTIPLVKLFVLSQTSAVKAAIIALRTCVFFLSPALTSIPHCSCLTRLKHPHFRMPWLAEFTVSHCVLSSSSASGSGLSLLLKPVDNYNVSPLYYN